MKPLATPINSLGQPMRQLSAWARENRTKAILALIILHTALVFCGILAGWLLFTADISIGKPLLNTAAILSLIPFFLYPVRTATSGFFQHTYWKQKTMDFCILLSTFLLIALGSNHIAQPIEAQYLNASGEARLIALQEIPKKIFGPT